MDADLPGERPEPEPFDGTGQRVGTPDEVTECDVPLEFLAPAPLVGVERRWCARVDHAGGDVGRAHPVEDAPTGERFGLSGGVPDQERPPTSHGVGGPDGDEPRAPLVDRRAVAGTQLVEPAGRVVAGADREAVLDAGVAAGDPPREEGRRCSTGSPTRTT